MTNEQMLNAMIPGALKRLEDAGSLAYIGATAMVSASDLRVLLAHVAALKADAERYRWLRGPALHGDKQRVIGYKGEFLDAKIDAAMNGA